MKRSRTYYNLPGLLEETERAMKASSPLDTTPCNGRLCPTDVTDDPSEEQHQSSLSSSFPPTLRPCELLFRKRRRQHSGGRDGGDDVSSPCEVPLEPEPLSPLLSDSWGWIPLSPVPDEHACGMMLLDVEPCGYDQGPARASSSVAPLHSLEGEGEGEGDHDTRQATSTSASGVPSSWALPPSRPSSYSHSHSSSSSSTSPHPFRALSAFAACHVLPRTLSTPALLSCTSLQSASTLSTSASILSSLGSVSSSSLTQLSASTSTTQLAGLDTCSTSLSPDTRVSHTDLTRLTHDLDHLRLHRHFSSACDMASMDQGGSSSSSLVGRGTQPAEGRSMDKPRCAALPPPLCLPPPASSPVITAAAAAAAPLASGGWERQMGSCSPSLAQRKHRMAMPPRDCRVPMPPLLLDHHSRRHRTCVWDAPVGAAECK